MRWKKFLVPLFLVSSFITFAQHSEYNLPPGYHLNPNKVIIDLSHKIENKNVEKEYKKETFKFLKDVDDSELHLTSPEYQNYIKEGKKFISKLSKKVKDIYTESELWYIYAFDQKLKERLLKLN